MTFPIASYAVRHAVNPDDGQCLGFEGFEYLLQPMNDASPRVVLQKGAQVGATVMAILRALWFVEAWQAQTLYLFPTHRAAARFARSRLAVLLDHSPHWRNLFRAGRRLGHLRAGPVNFYCHGGRSRTELMSLPIQYLTIDERDEMYHGEAAAQQGWSAVELARQRLSGQVQAWELDLSTPTIPGRGIAADYAASDRHEFCPRCPHCQRRVPLTWPAALQGHDGPPEQAAWACPACRRTWSAAERRAALRHGRWVAQEPSAPTRGYHIPQLLAPAPTPERLAAQWQAAQANPAALQVFYNAVLGLPHLADGTRLEPHYIDLAMSQGGQAPAPPGPLPPGDQVMGVDVGPVWLHVVVATPTPAGLRIVWVGMVDTWPRLAEVWRHLGVGTYVIDAQPETHQARQFVAQHPRGFLCYYREITGGRLHAQDHVVQVGRTESLDAMFQLWRSGQVALPRNTPEAFKLQLRALARIVRLWRDGTPRADYVEVGGADHYAHAMNYAALAAVLRGGPCRFDVTLPGTTRLAWE